VTEVNIFAHFFRKGKGDSSPLCPLATHLL